jgi:lycopene cyclase CruA
MPVAPHDRVLLVGDAASRHSPLTFCGFGSMIRSFWPVAREIMDRLRRDRLDRRSLRAVWPEMPALRVMGGLTLMMIAERPGRRKSPLARDPQAINRLLDAAFASLAELGQETYSAFIRDEIAFAPFIRFMRLTAAREPSVYHQVFHHLRKSEILAWLLRLMSLATYRRALPQPT